jgi:hypothetical protein
MNEPFQFCLLDQGGYKIPFGSKMMMTMTFF